MSIDGIAQGAATTNTAYAAIWDGNGTDTYDLSNYTTALSIDLRPGEWSLLSTAQLANLGAGNLAHGNISNAKGSSAVGAIQEALEGVAFKDRSQVGRFTLSLEPEIGGQAPFFSVVVKCLGNPFDTL